MKIILKSRVVLLVLIFILSIGYLLTWGAVTKADRMMRTDELKKSELSYRN